jgi:O-antigen/teichoic acid export membrane protein
MALMQRNMEFYKLGKIEVCSNIASVFIGVVLLAFTKSYWVLLLTSVSYFIFQIIFTFKLSTWRHKFSNPFNNRMSRTGSVFGMQLTAFNLMTFLSINLDNIIIGKIAGVAVLGNYTKSFEIGNYTIDKLIRKPIQQVYFSDLPGKSHSEKCNLYFQYLFLMVSLILLIIGPGLIYTEWVVNTFFDPKWQLLIKMLPPFFLCTLFWITMALADQLLIVTNNLKRYVFLGLLKGITGSLAIIIASFWGAKAIAYSFLIYHVVLFIPFCYSIFSAIGMGITEAKNMMRTTCTIVIPAMLCVLIPFILRVYNLVSSELALTIFVSIYIVLHLFFWPKVERYRSFKLFFFSLITRKVGIEKT